MKYAGFWPRVVAGLIDSILIFPLAALQYWSISTSHSTALWGSIFVAILIASYYILMIGYTGQTIGKAIVKIKVVSLEGSPAGMVRAFYRHSVDLIFSLISTVSIIYALTLIANTDFDSLSRNEKWGQISKPTAHLDFIIAGLAWLWMLSEFFVLLLNEKRRALHDYIAGTVVIHKNS